MDLKEALNLNVGNRVYVIGLYKSTGEPAEVKVNGKIKTWKTRPNEIQIPFKHGLKTYGYITEENLTCFTRVKPECIPRKMVKEVNAKFKGV